MNFKTDILPWMPLVTVLIPLLAASIAYLIRTNTEQTRVVKKVLYYLLEIRHKTRFLEPLPKEQFEKFASEYCQELKNNGIEGEALPPPETLRQIMEWVFNQITQQQAALTPEFIKNYQSTLETLAGTQPVLAFVLNGSEQLSGLMQNLEALNADVLRKLPYDEDEPIDIEEVIQAINHESKEGNVRVVREPIDQLIRCVSWKCGILHWWRTRRVLKAWNDPKHQEFEFAESKTCADNAMRAFKSLGITNADEDPLLAPELNGNPAL